MGNVSPTSAEWTRRVTAGRMALAVIVLAALVRVLYFHQLPQTFVEMDRWSQSDMHYYRTWSQQIARGDWWSEKVFVPEAAWHEEVVVKHIQGTPGSLEQLRIGQRPEGVTATAYVWGQWMHLPRFYQDPLYPYLLAATAVVFSANVQAVFIWQLLLGIASTLLIWDLTRRCFGDGTAAMAAALTILCSPFVYYEQLLLRESAIVCASLLTAWLLQRSATRGSALLFGVTGVVVGVATMLKSSLLLFAIGPPVAVLWLWRTAPRRWPALMAAFLIGLGVGLGPLVVRNLIVGVPPLALASSGPLTFVSANEPTYRPQDGNYINTDVLARFLGRSDGGWASAMSYTLGQHTIESYLTLLAGKFSRAWHWYELPNNDNFYLRRLRVPLLQWLPVTGWLISPLALVGLILGLRRFREAWPLYQLLLLTLAPLLAFYVVGRFRLVLLAAAIPFAAFTLSEIIGAVSGRAFRRAAVVAMTALLVGLWTGRPLSADMQLIRTDDWLLPYSVRYQPQMQHAGERGDFTGAAQACEGYFSEAPTPHELSIAGHDPQLLSLLADLRMRCAALWKLAGNDTRAAAQAAAADAIRLGRYGPPR